MVPRLFRLDVSLTPHHRELNIIEGKAGRLLIALIRASDLTLPSISTGTSLLFKWSYNTI